jgi:phage I-like protein
MKLRAKHVELCESSATQAENRNVVMCKIALTSGKAPDRIPLFPAPAAEGMIKARDGRIFWMKDAARVVAEFNTDGHEIPLDWEHAAEIKAPMGEPAPAAGWISLLSLESDGSIWGSVEWTDRGRASVESREYRYISPAFRLDPETREVLQLLTAGLTNTPAMTMPALTHVQNGEPKMNPELLKLLGLDEKATSEQVVEATKQLQAKISAESEAKVAAEAASKKLEAELASARSSQPSLKDFVPRADYDATLARVEVLEKKAADEKAAAHKVQVDAEIASAMKAGKITPATKSFYEKTCATADGLAAFREFCSSAPVIAPDNIVQGQPAAVTQESDLSELDFEVASRMGLSREDLIKANKKAA